jgi:uncharacterized protein YuzE
MINGTLNNSGRLVNYEYDDVQDMLFILFVPGRSHAGYYIDADGLRNVMLRYDENDQIIGVSALFPETMIDGAVTDESIRALTQDLIRQTHLERVLEGA